MPIEVKMAKLSPTMESGQMVKWLVKVGDQVKEGDTLAEIQTDKAVMPMEAFDEGVVAYLDVKEGDDIALGQRVLLLAKKDEDFQQVAAQAASSGKSSTPVASATESATTAAVASTASVGGNGEHTSPGVRVKSTPLARKIATASQVNLSAVTGTGPGGRVIRRDVEAFVGGARPAAQGASASTLPSIARPAVTITPGKPARVPHSPMRKTIAKRMTESKQAIPEIHLTVDARIDSLLSIRESLNQQLATENVKLSVGDFITKATALALRKHPGVNASFEPDAIVYHPAVNVGIAVAIEGGLMVPVLQNADALGLREIRIATEGLASATRNGTLKPNQMMGGTFTISNLGMFGVKQFDAIINQPEVAILAVGAGEKRPVVAGNALVVGTVMSLTLTADHRAVDGALAAEFLRTLKGLLEEPASMLL